MAVSPSDYIFFFHTNFPIFKAVKDDTIFASIRRNIAFLESAVSATSKSELS
jgi:hypothetical protein